MLGLGSWSEPVFMKRWATSCAGISVQQRADDRHVIDHCAELAGSTSLTSTPDLPLLVNLKGEPKASPS